LSIVDIVLIVFLLIGAFGGYREGFLSTLFSLLAIILGILAGFKLMGNAMLMLSSRFAINEKILPYVAFAVVFIVVIICVSLLGKLLKSSLEKTVLGSADPVAGAGLGILKTAFMMSVVLWIIGSLNIEFPEHLTEDSWLYPNVQSFAPAVTSWVAEVFPVFSDLFGGNS
jgi:membrane protein required for colicin V production